MDTGNNTREIRSLLNRLQTSIVDALSMLIDEQEHHALSYRSISMIENYAQIFPEFWKPQVPYLDDATQQSLARWIEWILLTQESAQKEQSRDYDKVKRRTIIVMADLVEGAIESVISSCLRHLDTGKVTLRKLTGSKSSTSNERDLRYAVRTWERRLYANMPSRVSRIEKMLSTFFKDFVLPENAVILDRLFKLRNEFTHDLIIVTDHVGEIRTQAIISHEEIDNFFAEAGNLMISIMKGIPSDIEGPIPIFDQRFRPQPHEPRLDL